MSTPHPEREPEPGPENPLSPPPPPESESHLESKEETSRLPIKTYHCRFCSHLLLATTRDLDRLPRRRSQDNTNNNTNTNIDIDTNDNNNTNTMKDGDGDGVGGKDHAIILPLPVKRKSTTTTTTTTTAEGGFEDDHDHDKEDKDKKEQPKEKPTPKPKIIHTTILLSTILPDPSKTIIRRTDGFEKRLFLRCGRCRVVMGYFLDAVHFPDFNSNLNPNLKKIESAHVDDEEEGEGDDDDNDSNEPKVVYILPGALMETGVLGDGDEKRLRARDGEWMGWIQ